MSSDSEHIIELSSDSEEEQSGYGSKHKSNQNVNELHPSKESKEEGDGLKTEARMSVVYFHLESLRFSTSSPKLHLTQVK